MELNEKLQALESLNKLKQKVNTLDLTDSERKLFNSWYNERTTFFNEFVAKVFNRINTNFMFILPKEILIRIDNSEDFNKKYNEVIDNINFLMELSYQYIGDNLYAVIRSKDKSEYNSDNLLRFLEQLDKHEIYYQLLYLL